MSVACIGKICDDDGKALWYFWFSLSKLESISNSCGLQFKSLKRHMQASNLKDLKLGDVNNMSFTFKAVGAGFWALKQKDFRTAIQDIVMEVSQFEGRLCVIHFFLNRYRHSFFSLNRQLNEIPNDSTNFIFRIHSLMTTIFFVPVMKLFKPPPSLHKDGLNIVLKGF